MKVGRFSIGPGHPSFLIAEAGVNHNGDVELAMRLVDVAVAAGADAVKFQTFRADRIVSPEAPQAEYQKSNTGRVESQLEMIRRLELGAEDTARLFEHCHAEGILPLSTPFDEESADLLGSLGVEAFKVASGELTNHRLLRHLAAKGRPLLISTGMADLDEVGAALEVVSGAGNADVCLLHCVSDYPASPGDCNLRAIETMRRAFDVPVGWSDHTLGLHVALGAVALGADCLEKHFTSSRSLPGPDHAASLEPHELAQLVRAVREVEASLGDGRKRMQPSERNTAAVARRSVHAARSLERGRPLEAADLVARRPGTGIPAQRIEELVGRRPVRDIAEGAMLAEADLD